MTIKISRMMMVKIKKTKKAKMVETMMKLDTDCQEREEKRMNKNIAKMSVRTTMVMMMMIR
jgi:hypothetical protein